jgi:hypothetical protein
MKYLLVFVEYAALVIGVRRSNWKQEIEGMGP